MGLVDKVIQGAVEKGGAIATFKIVMPDGSIKQVGLGKKDDFVFKIKSKEVYSAVVRKGELGLGEQYMLGNWDVEGDFYKALEVASILKVTSESHNAVLNLFGKLYELIKPNNRHNSLKNVIHHYDLGNDFYEKWLDKSMTYSCAYFKDPKDSIDKAQQQKLEHICRKLMLKKGETLVDIGSGWGSMLIYAAKNYGVKGYGVTLSKEQVEYANERAKKEKVDHLVKFELKDYRDIAGEFDKFVSIGMFEHVGRDYYNQFFQVVKRILKPEGVGVLHTIGTDRPWPYSAFAWVDKYIFPGGYLPASTMLFESSTKSGMIPLDFENLRMHYAYTLGRWIEGYEKIYDETVKERGETFARMWKLYLYISRANFEFGDIRLFQLTFSNGRNNKLPLTREHIYK